jgi:hypothetical protein
MFSCFASVQPNVGVRLCPTVITGASISALINCHLEISGVWRSIRQKNSGVWNHQPCTPSPRIVVTVHMHD